jgi:methionyl aminopeptidase
MSMAVSIKNADDIAKMRVACRLASEVLDYITPYVVPEVTTGRLDRLCYNYMREVQNTIPAPLNYQPPGLPPFPKATCISVNDVVCHGIPGTRILREGDQLNIDITVIKDGYFGDTSRMFVVGQVSASVTRLIRVCYESMWLGIEQVRAGARLGDVGHAIQLYAEAHGYGVVRDYCGHGIGTIFHEEPQVLHYGEAGTGLELQAGMIFTIEPLINAGGHETVISPDKWTVRTADHSLSAQWEHTVLVTESGYDVLTVSAGSPGRSVPGMS